MADRELDVQTVMQRITEIGPSLGCDCTYGPVFPEGRKDICAVRRLAENGTSYGYDTIYLVWMDKEGKIQARAIADSRGSKDYLSVKSVKVDGEKVSVTYGSGGTYSGRDPWEETYEAKLPE